MFYGTGDQIALATSKDGKSFKRRIPSNGKVGMFSNGYGTRDPMTIRVVKDFSIPITPPTPARCSTAGTRLPRTAPRCT